MSLKHLLSLLFILSSLVLACSSDTEQPPDNLIEESTYINLLIEMQLTKTLQETIAPDSNFTDRLLPQIMTKYGVTEKQFKKSHSYYQNQPQEQERRINEAIERLRMDRVSRDTSSKAPELQ